MEEILAQQRKAAAPMTGRRFLLGVAGIIVRLALAQVIVNLAITASGIGLLNVAFYLYAVLVMIRFMRQTVAGSVYTLKEKTLVLQKMLGDSTTSVVEIPLSLVVSVRPVLAGERLACCYRRVTVMDHEARVPMRVRLAFALSLVSARLARCVAGETVGRELGLAVIYEEGGQRQACVFRPDEDFSLALRNAVPEAYGKDERALENGPATLMARSLQRAFADLYPYVPPLVREDAAAAARAEIARQRQESKARKGTERRAKGKDAPGDSNKHSRSKS